MLALETFSTSSYNAGLSSHLPKLGSRVVAKGQQKDRKKLYTEQVYDISMPNVRISLFTKAWSPMAFLQHSSSKFLLLELCF